MFPTDVMNLIRKIEATPSRNEKEVLLAELAADELGRFALKWSYDSFVTFGITPAKLPGTGSGYGENFIEVVEKHLGWLARRELTGNTAHESINALMQSLDTDGAELLYRILDKDLKCGIGETTIAAVVPGLIPVFAVMRAQSYNVKKIKTWPVNVEPKMDGVRISFLMKNDMGGFFTRSGNRLEAYDHLVDPMLEVVETALASPSISSELAELLVDANGERSFMLDCEGIAGNRYETIGTSKRGEAGTNLVLHAFDIMSYADFDAEGSVGQPYVKRRQLLSEFIDFAKTAGYADRITKTPSYLCNTDAEVQHYYGKFLERGLEGAMVKNPMGLYDKGKTYGWMKLKPEDTEDLPIVGFYNGETGDKYEDLMGGVIVRRPWKDGEHVDVRIGGGWSDAQRSTLAQLWAEDAKTLGINPKVGFKPGFVGDPAISYHGFKLLGRLLEVKFQQVSIYGSLEHPRAIKFRDDKAGEKSKIAKVA